MTTFGFFSLVQNRFDPATLVVRGRVRSDLVRFVRRAKVDVPVLETTAADYRYRVILDRKTVGKVLARESRRLDYINFKDRVDEVQGAARHDIYSQVWSILRSLNQLPSKARG